MAERSLRIRGEALFRRCVRCNRRTRETPRREVRGRVPPYVFRTQRRFTSCPRCGRIYWRATHVSEMLQALRARVA